ncbi:hypothetical protein KAI54_02670 [Candidatus Gracilibacteria bacterium]|nr:hypothetical protein [Candidatus Gracilibacteria bacterium]
MREATDTPSPQRDERRNEIGGTLEQIPDQELVLPLHNPPTCWKILNEQVFETNLNVLSFQDVLGPVSTNLGKYPNLNRILNAPRRQNANPQIIFPEKERPTLLKELQALSEELLLTAGTKLRRKEMPAGLKNSDDFGIYCAFLEEGEKKKKVIKKGTKRSGRPRNKDIMPKKIQKLQEMFTAYITESNAKHKEEGIFDLNARTTFKSMFNNKDEEKSFEERVKMLEHFNKYSDILWEKLNGFTPDTIINIDDTQYGAELSKPEKMYDELNPPDNFVETFKENHKKEKAKER